MLEFYGFENINGIYNQIFQCLQILIPILIKTIFYFVIESIFVREGGALNLFQCLVHLST